MLSRLKKSRSPLVQIGFRLAANRLKVFQFASTTCYRACNAVFYLDCDCFLHSFVPVDLSEFGNRLTSEALEGPDFHIAIGGANSSSMPESSDSGFHPFGGRVSQHFKNVVRNRTFLFIVLVFTFRVFCCGL